MHHQAETELTLKTTGDIHRFMRLYVAPAALNAAMELRLFWRLDDEPAAAERIAQDLSIPLHRCRRWLELLADLGLLEQQAGKYAPSPVARTAIIEAYSPEVWVLIAGDSRDRYPIGHDLTRHITHPESVWTAQGLTPPDYLQQMIDDPERARRFARILYEIHAPFAERLAEMLDMSGVRKLMDLGGGSGVWPLALLQKNPDLNALVIDFENVCRAGREIAAETAVADRIRYQAVDFMRDDLPAGFDMILHCDVGIYTEELFGKVHAALNPQGRLVIVDWIRRPGWRPTLLHRIHTFSSSLQGQYTIPDTAEIRQMLENCGFEWITERLLEPTTCHEISGIPGPVVIEARKY
ncbi:MAG: hypothetical protein JSV91_12350 [Phycisphaerales bacterium]|nr:MAG: hypothetical protein JSV91_12350 [Phycisphaerales bacterium]